MLILSTIEEGLTLRLTLSKSHLHLLPSKLIGHSSLKCVSKDADNSRLTGSLSMMCRRFVAGRAENGWIVPTEASALVASMGVSPMAYAEFLAGRAGNG